MIVGGGISGLAAALFHRQRVGGQSRILVLDNHDDFGGHAKRNEFDVDGKLLIGYGGSQSIDTPGRYSEVAGKLLQDIAIHTERFYDYFDQDYYSRRGLGRAIYFSRDAYGADSVHPDVTWFFGGTEPHRDIPGTVSRYPLSDASRADLMRLLIEDVDHLKGMGRQEKVEALRVLSYTDFLERRAGVTGEVATLLPDTTKGFWGVGWDAISALEAFRLGMPGTGGGFDPARDIAALTVNRWPHGYAFEYNEYSDPPEYSSDNGPHIAGRARIGRISIANSDASAYAYVDGAIDAAHRAVNEQLALE